MPSSSAWMVTSPPSTPSFTAALHGTSWNQADRDFGPYFLELVQHIDSTYRTFADRRHRATSGLSMGGFMTST